MCKINRIVNGKHTEVLCLEFQCFVSQIDFFFCDIFNHDVAGSDFYGFACCVHSFLHIIR